MATVLEVEHLTKRYWDFTLDDLCLNVPRGCITGIIGPSGAGKTTLVKLAMNLIPATSGQVRVFGLTHAEAEKEIKNRIGYVGEEHDFCVGHTVEWIGRFVAHFFDSWNGTLFARLLADFGIESGKKIKQLSRGRKTLLAVAIALSHEADLFILDEPTAGLDLMARRSILKTLRELVEDEEKTVLISSHNTDGLSEIADELVFLHEGRLRMQENRQELLARWKWIHFREGTLEPELIALLTGVERQPFGSKGLTRDYAALRGRLEGPVAGGEVKVENASLDDVLITLMAGESK
jgi:ABC-2 type transport system ATP-binding protein